MLRRVRELQLGPLALGDVGEDALEAGLAVVVDDPARLIAHPHDVPVGVQEAVLVVEQPGLLGVALVAHHLRAVVRVDARQPQLGIGHPLLGREAQHRLDLGAHIEAAPRRARLPAIRGDGHALEQRSKALFPEWVGGSLVHGSSSTPGRRALQLPYRHLCCRS